MGGYISPVTGMLVHDDLYEYTCGMPDAEFAAYYGRDKSWFRPHRESRRDPGFAQRVKEDVAALLGEER